MFCPKCNIEVETPYCNRCGVRVTPVKGFNDIDDGVEFEKHCAELLTLNDFYNVETTLSSFDFGVDILAEKDDVSYAFQCKRYASSVGPNAVQQVLAGRIHYKRDVAVVMTNSRFTGAAKKLASETGVKLWDRERLMKLEDTASERRGILNLAGINVNNDESMEVLQALQAIMERGAAASTIIDDELDCGYERASEIMRGLEKMGFVSPRKPDMTRDVLISDERWEDIKKKWNKF